MVQLFRYRPEKQLCPQLSHINSLIAACGTVTRLFSGYLLLHSEVGPWFFSLVFYKDGKISSTSDSVRKSFLSWKSVGSTVDCAFRLFDFGYRLRVAVTRGRGRVVLWLNLNKRRRSAGGERRRKLRNK